jgi:hypothetical protein
MIDDVLKILSQELQSFAPPLADALPNSYKATVANSMPAPTKYHRVDCCVNIV